MTELPISLYQGACRHVEFIRYPDGQQTCQLDMEYFNDVKLPVAINCSIRGFDDLERLLCLVAALQRNDFVITEITFWYLFGMRSDRAFSIGQPNYFRDVLAPILTRLPGRRKNIFCPHGTIALKQIQDCGWHDIDSDEIDKVIYTEHYDNKYIVIAGDKSFFDAGFVLSQDAYFRKIRQPNGRIDSLSLRDKSDQNIANQSHDWGTDKPFLIVDDLCDGGATFKAGGELLKLLWPEHKRYLFVAHGLFSKGFDHLLEVFDGIITTNSYQDFIYPNPIPEQVKVIEVIKP